MDMNRETQIFDCLAELYMEAELDVLREDSVYTPLQVSDRFRRRIQLIILRERAAAAARRVAAVILAILTVTGSLMLINEDVRAEIIRFFRRVYPTHTEYHFNDSAMEWKSDFRYYEPTWLPEGYEEANRSMRAEGMDRSVMIIDRAKK